MHTIKYEGCREAYFESTIFRLNVIGRDHYELHDIFFIIRRIGEADRNEFNRASSMGKPVHGQN